MTVEWESVKARDGEVVLYRRPHSSRWQARFKLPDNRWYRISTRRTSLDEAKRVACDEYDKARFRAKEGLIAVSRRFRDVGRLAIQKMAAAIEGGHGKSIFRDYIHVIDDYLVPFFNTRRIDTIREEDLVRFDTWRAEKMGKVPSASTLNTHNAALNRVFETALNEGWITKKAIPSFTSKGLKAKARPYFDPHEWNSLRSHLFHWCNQGQGERTKQMRELMRDYVMIVANTGMRPGTEAYNLKWKQLKWAVGPDKNRYLVVAVSGKTGPRELVARHNSIKFFMRIQSRFAPLAAMSFDELLAAKIDDYVFRLSSGERTKNLYQTFHQFLSDVGLLTDVHGENRTLYSLRHMYATARIVVDKVDLHQLAVQMGTSVAMLEKFYSKLEPLMVADHLAGRLPQDAAPHQ